MASTPGMDSHITVFVVGNKELLGHLNRHRMKRQNPGLYVEPAGLAMKRCT